MTFFRHLSELQQLLCRFPALCVALQETWFPFQQTPALRGYQGYYKNRSIYDGIRGCMCVSPRIYTQYSRASLHNARGSGSQEPYGSGHHLLLSLIFPPDEVITPADLSALVTQLSTPFIIPWDFNAHHPL